MCVCGGEGGPRLGIARLMAIRARFAALKSFATQRKVLLGVGALVLVGAGTGIGLGQTGGASSSTNKDLVILANVQRRTLQDTITLNGTLARKEITKVTPVTQGRVSTIYRSEERRVGKECR